MERNPMILSTAFKRVKGKLSKIKELGITSTMSEEEVDALILKLAKDKAKEDGKSYKDHLKGMRWFVEELVKFSGLNSQEMLDACYEEVFPQVASEAEMLAAIEAAI